MAQARPLLLWVALVVLLAASQLATATLASLGPVDGVAGNKEILSGLLQAIHQQEVTVEDSMSRREVSQMPEWRELILQAVERDIYHTANSALTTLRGMLARKELSLANLECADSEEITLRSSGQVGRFTILVAVTDQEALSQHSEDSQHYSYRSGACNEGILSLPKSHFEPPKEVGRQTRAITTVEQHNDVLQFAQEQLAQRTGRHTTMRVAQMSEETRQYSHCGAKSFLVGVIAVAAERKHLLVVYYPPASSVVRKHEEKDYAITLVAEDAKHKVVVSSLAPNNYVLAAHSVFPIEGNTEAKRTAMPWKALSYNIWNWNGDWEARKALIVATIQREQPDVIGFQEIRYRYGNPDNQLSQIARSFPTYNYIYQPAMRYDTDAEGVGIMTRYPIVFSNYTNLKYLPGSADVNTRIALRTSLDSAEPLDFFVTHFSYAKGPGQMQNAWDLLNFMDLSDKNDPVQVVVGDFNIYTDSLGPTNFLTGKDTFNGRRGNLKDVWETVHGNDPGYTFSNLPSSRGLINRADRILMRGRAAPTAVERVGQYKPSEGTPASDHLGVLATFA